MSGNDLRRRPVPDAAAPAYRKPDRPGTEQDRGSARRGGAPNVIRMAVSVSACFTLTTEHLAVCGGFSELPLFIPPVTRGELALDTNG